MHYIPACIGDATTSATARRLASRSRGQALVEFALILPVLVLIMALAADFGRAFTAYIAISSAAREGASYGSQSTFQASDGAGIRAAALAETPDIWGVTPTVSSALCADSYGYTCVEVTVNYTFEPFIPIPPIPNSVDLERTVRMRVLN